MSTATATPTATKTQGAAMPAEGQPVLLQVKAANLNPNPDNPRKDLGDLTELSASIAAQGVQQPLVVTSADKQGRHTIIMGHRRYAAAIKAGLDTLPCIVRKAGQQEQAELMLVENTQRAGLTPIEEAKGYARLLELGESEDQMAKATGRSRTTVRRRLRAASLDPTLLPDRQVSFDQLDRIAGFDGRPDLQKKLMKAAGTNNWAAQLAKCEKSIEDEKWLEEARTVVESLGLDTIDEMDDLYDRPEGYRRVETISTGHDIAAAMSEMDIATRQSLTTADIINNGKYDWNRGVALLHRYTPKELDERKREQEQADKEEALRQAQREQAERDERERNAKLYAFAQMTEKLVLDHIEHITKRATPLKNSATILADALMHDRACKADLTSVKPGPAYDDVWGQGTDLLSPDDKHRQQAAIWLLLSAGQLTQKPYDWTDEHVGLRMLRQYYGILAQTGYKPSDDEKAALEGAYLPKDEQEEPDQEQEQD
ncbi:ParB/RepB/Spo0J family partition protein [Bifidobacterium sp. ESL0820]|uniref:ParB/RepB/Spo0J family partition protein n=1 Tax=Bifidobacterium sp. ESL0820 TaxID=3448586 RepID=UPI004042704D